MRARVCACVRETHTREAKNRDRDRETQIEGQRETYNIQFVINVICACEDLVLMQRFWIRSGIGCQSMRS